MESGKESVDLLVDRDYAHALHQAHHIDKYNEKRKDIDKQMTEEANNIVARLESQRHHSSIVLYDEHWKKGVIGIVASRLTEIYFRPTVVLTRDGDYATGSARSVTGFDILSYQVVQGLAGELRGAYLCRGADSQVGGHSRILQSVPTLCGGAHCTGADRGLIAS